MENARDFAKRGQEVWVKVISKTAGRLSLSMRDVDQASGKDLLPVVATNGSAASQQVIWLLFSLLLVLPLAVSHSLPIVRSVSMRAIILPSYLYPLPTTQPVSMRFILLPFHSQPVPLFSILSGCMCAQSLDKEDPG